MLKHIFVILLISLSFVMSACDKTKNLTNNDFEINMDEAFSNLACIYQCFDYPQSKQILVTALKNNDKQSLKLYNDVKKAKGYIISQIQLDPEKALAFTLDTILNICDQNQDQISLKEDTICTGAISSIFFFNQEKYDQLILEKFNKASLKILRESIFRFNYEWFHNRPKPEKWVKFINSLPNAPHNQENPFNNIWKERMIEDFTAKDFEKRGLMMIP